MFDPFVKVSFFQRTLCCLSDCQYLQTILLHLNIFQYIRTVKCLKKCSDFTSSIIFSENNLPFNYNRMVAYWIFLNNETNMEILGIGNT